MKRRRNLTTLEWCRAMATRQEKELLFKGKIKRDFETWRKRFQPRFREILGRFPPKAPLRAEILERREFRTYIREKVVFDSEPCMSVPAWVCWPRGTRKSRPLRAVLCCHGHGTGAKMMVGLDDQNRPSVSYAKNLAIKLAEAGYVAISPDFRGFGERYEPPESDPRPRDPCNLSHLVAEHFGYTQLALNVWDGMRAIDYLFSRQTISRLGCVGCSFGGALTLFLSAVDRRVHSACISGCLIDSLTNLLQWNICGSQTPPGLLRWGDLAEVAGLICPRPLLIQVGRYDPGISWSAVQPEYKRLKSIYLAAGKPEKLGLDLFDGCHEINAPPILSWFNRWLK